jgi:hypothetical protein
MKRRELIAAAVAAPLALGLPDRISARGAGGSPTILVTADLESRVVALDAATGRVVRRIRTRPGPRSVESAFMTWAVVAHTASGLLSILDASTLRLQRVISGFHEPRYTAVHPSRFPAGGDPLGTALAYVTDSARREVVSVDVARGRILWRTAVPGPARHIGIDAAGERLWTVLGNKAERVAVLDLEDPRRPRLVGTLSPPFLAHDVVVSGFGGQPARLWLTSGDERRIAVYELDGRRPVAVVPADAPPQHIAFRGGAAFVASGADGTMRRLSHRTGALLNASRIPVGSYNVTLGWSGIVTPSLDRGTVAMLDPDGEVRHVRHVARATHDACLVVSA